MAAKIVAYFITNEKDVDETVLTISKEEDTLILEYYDSKIAVDVKEFLKAVIDVILEEVKG